MTTNNILELQQSLPVITPKGRGHAILVIDYGPEDHLFWVVVQDGGEIWTVPNPEVRVQPNWTRGRR